MAKNQKHEKKHNVQNGDRIEVSAESCQACEEQLEKKRCNSFDATNKADTVQSGATQDTTTPTEEIGAVQDGGRQNNKREDMNASSKEASTEELSVAELSKEVEKWKNEYLRKAADFENYRKRMIKEKKDAIDYANENILQDLVNVLDDFDRGIDAVEKYATDAVKPYMQGFTMIRGQLYSMLESKYSLKCYKSEGEVFDPNIHDAKASRESEDVEIETVEKELLKGYKLHDRVIRVAQVETIKPKK